MASVVPLFLVDRGARLVLIQYVFVSVSVFVLWLALVLAFGRESAVSQKFVIYAVVSYEYLLWLRVGMDSFYIYSL